MSLIAISDESGCLGVSYNKRSSLNYVISTACFSDEEALNAFVDAARTSCRTNLRSRLRKWSELKGEHKNNPKALEGFVFDLFSEVIKRHPFVLSFFILNKSEIECGYKSLSIDKILINNEAELGYTLCFKRIFPFVKKLHYVARRYRLGQPQVKWFVDINDGRFQKKQNHKMSSLAQQQAIDLSGPIFLSKSSADNRNIISSIKVIDIIGGIVSRAFDEYTSHINCPEIDCFDVERCNNKYINVWKIILDYTTNVDISYKDEPFWNWYGILYSPASRRSNHNKFLKSDEFFK